MNYLFSTIDSLISGMDEKRASQSLILVSIAPPPGALLAHSPSDADADGEGNSDADATGTGGSGGVGGSTRNASELTELADELLDELEARFGPHIRSGLLELLVVPPEYYPSLLPYPLELNAELERVARESQSFVELQKAAELEAQQQQQRGLVPPLALNREFSREFRYLRVAPANASAARRRLRRGHAHRGPGNVWSRGDTLQRTVWRSAHYE